MKPEELIFVGICDVAGHVRGKGFPASELKTRRKAGIGWTHSNMMQTAFGPILDTPFGTGGDLMVVPDPSAEVRLDFGDGSAPEHFFLGDIRNTDGSPWECDTREFLRRAIATLKAASGLHVRCAFEQEFVYTGDPDVPGHAYSLAAWRRQAPFGQMLMAALRQAGVEPDSFLPEYGQRQFEVTVKPQDALKAADWAVIAREVVRAVAHRLGHRAIFSPMPAADGVGNGVHIHFSLHEPDGAPVAYDPDGPMGLSKEAAWFCAGVLQHMSAMTAITAPSPVSYLRLTPNRWAPTLIDIVKQDRGAALRVCPVFAAKGKKKTAAAFHLEYRLSDGSANPYLTLGAMIFAGADGITRRLTLPAPGATPKQLPHSLAEALDNMEASAAIKDWMGPTFFEAYMRHKRSELGMVAGLEPAELCDRFAEVY